MVIFHKVSDNFLDVTVSINVEELETDICCKLTELIVINFLSLTPTYNKQMTNYNKGLCIERLCSKSSKLGKYLEISLSSFDERGYPKNLVDN